MLISDYCCADYYSIDGDYGFGFECVVWCSSAIVDGYENDKYRDNSYRDDGCSDNN